MKRPTPRALAAAYEFFKPHEGEIAENLHRAELTVLERDEQVAEWIELSAKVISAQPEPKMDRGRPESGIAAASRDLGIERKDAQRAVKVASLTDEAKQAARGSSPK